MADNTAKPKSTFSSSDFASPEGEAAMKAFKVFKEKFDVEDAWKRARPKYEFGSYKGEVDMHFLDSEVEPVGRLCQAAGPFWKALEREVAKRECGLVLVNNHICFMRNYEEYVSYRLKEQSDQRLYAEEREAIEAQKAIEAEAERLANETPKEKALRAISEAEALKVSASLSIKAAKQELEAVKTSFWDAFMAVFGARRALSLAKKQHKEAVKKAKVATSDLKKAQKEAQKEAKPKKKFGFWFELKGFFILGLWALVIYFLAWPALIYVIKAIFWGINSLMGG